jgi:hypothetical protein
MESVRIPVQKGDDTERLIDGVNANTSSEGNSSGIDFIFHKT